MLCTKYILVSLCQIQAINCPSLSFGSQPAFSSDLKSPTPPHHWLRGAYRGRVCHKLHQHPHVHFTTCGRPWSVLFRVCRQELQGKQPDQTTESHAPQQAADMSGNRPDDDGYVSAEDEDFVLDAAQAAADDALDAAETGGLAPDSDGDDLPAGAGFYERRAAKRKKYDRKMKELQNRALTAMSEIDPVWKQLNTSTSASCEEAMKCLPWQSAPKLHNKAHRPTVKDILDPSIRFNAQRRGMKRPRADISVRKQHAVAVKFDDFFFIQAVKAIMKPSPHSLRAPKQKQSSQVLQAAFDAVHRMQSSQSGSGTVEIQQKVRFAGKTTVYVSERRRPSLHILTATALQCHPSCTRREQGCCKASQRSRGSSCSCSGPWFPGRLRRRRSI